MCGPHWYVIPCAALVKIVSYFLAQSAMWVEHSWTRSTNYQSTYCNYFPTILSYFKHSAFNNIPENLSERRAWLQTNITLHGLGYS